MSIHLKCFSTLVNPGKCDFSKSTDYEPAEGQTVENLINHSGIKIDDVKITFINSRVVGLYTV